MTEVDRINASGIRNKGWVRATYAKVNDVMVYNHEHSQLWAMGVEALGRGVSHLRRTGEVGHKRIKAYDRYGDENTRGRSTYVYTLYGNRVLEDMADLRDADDYRQLFGLAKALMNRKEEADKLSVSAAKGFVGANERDQQKRAYLEVMFGITNIRYYSNMLGVKPTEASMFARNGRGEILGRMSPDEWLDILLELGLIEQEDVKDFAQEGEVDRFLTTVDGVSAWKYPVYPWHWLQSFSPAWHDVVSSDRAKLVYSGYIDTTGGE